MNKVAKRKIQQELIEFAEKWIMARFGCRPSLKYPKLSFFIHDLLCKTRISMKTLIMALFYLERLKELHPMCKGSDGSAHRLFLSALIIASKVLYDDTFHNSSWALASRYSLEDVNRMEMELLCFLGWKLHVSRKEYDLFVEYIDAFMRKY